MLLEQGEPIALCLARNSIGELQYISMLRQHLAVIISSTAGLTPVLRADKHDQLLLGRINHMRERLLQYWITVLNRQECKNICVRNDLPSQPKVCVMSNQ